MAGAVTGTVAADTGMEGVTTEAAVTTGAAVTTTGEVASASKPESGGL